MSMEINDNYSSYVTSYANTTKESTTKNYTNEHDYKSYLTDKYDCFKSKDYSVSINSSLLSEALGDEKTSKWLEYNLALIPETVEKTKAQVAARGAKIISYNITIEGYDSMKTELCTQVEADTGVEKARKELKEKIKKIREEKKEKEEQMKEKAEEEKTDEISDTYTMIITSSSAKEATQKFVEKWVPYNESNVQKSGVVGFDMKA